MAAKTGDRAAANCLVLFALPFAGVGVFALYLALSTLFTWARMQSWVEVPASIESLALEEHDGDDSRTYEVTAAYRFSFGGRDYVGERVAISGMADNIGSFHQDLYGRLRASNSTRAYVDASNPSSATLNRDLRPGLLALELVFGLVFGAVGFGLVIGSRYGAKKAAAARDRAARFPAEPWRRREDWAAGAIKSSTRASAYVAAGFATIWNLVSLPALLFVPDEIAKGNYPALIALLFPLVGAGLAIWAARAWLQMRRFKSATLALDTTPVALGERLRGAIRVDAHVPATKEFRIDLSCIERVRRSTGKGSEASERLLWQNEWTIPRERCQLMDAYSSVPLDLPIPRELPPATTAEDDAHVEWRLDATAECPGPDFWMRFEVPVFAVEGRGAAPTLDEALAATGDEPAISTDAPPDAAKLASLGIVYTRSPQGGESWTFKRAQHKSVAALLTVITSVFGASAIFLFVADAPLLLPLAFASFDAIFLYWVLQLWFAEYRVTLDDRLLTVARKGLTGTAKAVELPRQWVKTVRAERGMQAGNKLYYDLKIETADTKLTAASSVADYTVATWLANRWTNGGSR